MSLENDIHQKEFRSEYQKAILNILYTQNYLLGRMTNVFKEYDLTSQQYNVLRILRGQYPGHASVNLIKERMLEKMSDTSRIVERLRLKGLIAREGGKNDKRSVEITITQQGLELLEKMQRPIDEFESFLHNLSTEEAYHLNRLLDKIRNKSVLEPAEAASELLSQPEKF